MKTNVYFYVYKTSDKKCFGSGLVPLKQFISSILYLVFLYKMVYQIITSGCFEVVIVFKSILKQHNNNNQQKRPA